ncbi:hypothetical protein FRB99_002115 [Tulasnella sp. 403]|nr:hypothetical protein FRB99_002115 [Tulasnella sp. 403]
MKQAVEVDSALIRRAVWRQWKHQYAETKRKKVQREMKKQVATMWQKIQHRVLRGAFYQWHHLHQVKTAERHHGEMVLLRAVQRWRARLAHVDQMDAIADQVLDARNRMTLEHCMEVWRRQERLRKSENVVLRVRDDRILAEAWQTWRNNAQRNREVNALRRRGILRTSLRKWSKALKRSRALERRADHYIHRQQQVLVRAVLRVWRAKELGERFLRFRQMRLLGAAVSVWKDKLTAVRQLDTRLQTYETRSRGDLLARSVQVWRYRCSVLARAAAVADEQHALQLKTRMLLDWRVQLAANLRRSKHARIARKWFTMRRAWKQWQFALEKKRREKKLAEYENRIVARAFNVWRIAAEKQRKNKFLVLAFKEKVNNRLLSTCINQWILNTVERKDYYIQAEEHRSAIVVRKAFEKWRDLYARYKEGMSLMQSYHDVKREDLLRRAFLRWLAGTRKSIYRKERLEQKQEERKQALVAKAWETWRDRFKERELGWAERQLKLQTDMNILFRAFRIWESKTMSVPALRFLNLNIKAKAWNRWRDALPRAQREHEARELDRSWVLAKAFSKWKDAYKGKIQLKSIARARHLRLPAVPTPRPTYRRPSIGIRTPKSAIARVVERLPSPEQPPSLYTQAPERKGTDDSDPSPVQRGSQSPVRGERKSLLSKAYLPTTKPLLNLNRPRHPASAPALSVGARSERGAPSVSGRSAGVPRDGSVVDDSSEAQSDAGSRKSARPSPTKEKGKETLAQRFGSLASAPNRTPTAARERLRLGLKSTSKRTGKL